MRKNEQNNKRKCGEFQIEKNTGESIGQLLREQLIETLEFENFLKEKKLLMSM